MANAQLVLLDHASGLSGQALQHFAAALDRQLAEDVAPAWGRYAVPWVGVDEGALSDAAWRLHFWRDVQDAKDAGVLGLHETRGVNHVPVGHVFVELCERLGKPWTVVASHEGVEMVGDEWVNLYVTRVRSDGVAELWPRELCDVVEGVTYMKDGLEVSDFVLPEFFIEGAGGPFDFTHALKAPFTVDPSGYASVRVLEGGKLTPQALYGAEYPDAHKTLRAHSRNASRVRTLAP